MNSYFSLYYILIFLPITILAYAICPKKYRYVVLLVASLAFYLIISSYLIIYLLLTATSVYFVGKKIYALQNSEGDKRVNGKRQSLFVALVIIFNLSVLVALKYSGFLFLNINHLFKALKINLVLKIPSFILPIGISFYTLQAISYLVDVKRGVIAPEKNFFKLLLFLSFFPIIIEGPISRYNSLSPSLFSNSKITEKNLRHGLIRILFGMIKKIVIADRLNFFVKTIFTNYQDYNGSLSFLAAIAYTVLLYMEFSGTMDIVIGTGEIFNIKISENFKRPFFSKSISEFWSRWHISLGAFFKDYVYYPISLSNMGKKIRKIFKGKLSNYTISLIISIIALFAVWVLNGLWHGSGYNYLFFGIYHFLLISIANILEPAFKKMYKKLKIDRNGRIVGVIRMLKTSLLVVFGELFFRASTLTDGFKMTKKIFTDFSFKALFNTKLSSIGLDIKDIIIVLITLGMVFAVSLCNEKNIKVRDSLDKKHIAIRYAVYYILIFYLIIFGAYGVGYIPLDPIYGNF